MLPGYSLHRSDRSSKKGGGTAVYVINTLSMVRRPDLEKSESVWVEINIPKSKGLLIGTYYRAPSESVSQPEGNFMDLFNENLDIASSEFKEIIITGDFNCDFLTSKPNSETKKLKNIFMSYDLDQQISVPTRITSDCSTLIDLFVTSNPSNISIASVAESSFSDHDMIIAVRKINNFKQPPKIIRCRNYVNYDPGQFCSDLSKLPWDSVLEENDRQRGLCGKKCLLNNATDMHHL